MRVESNFFFSAKWLSSNFCMLWYICLSSSQTKLSNGTLSSSTCGYCCHQAWVCGIASRMWLSTDQWETDRYRTVLLRKKEGRKEERIEHIPPKPNQTKKTFLSISSVVAYEEIAAVSCVCFTVSCCRLSVCLSVGEKQDTHCWWFQSAVWDFLRACSTCLSHPATVCTGYLLLFQARS